MGNNRGTHQTAKDYGENFQVLQFQRTLARKNKMENVVEDQSFLSGPLPKKSE